MVDFVLAGRRPGSQEKQESENTREISEVAAQDIFINRGLAEVEVSCRRAGESDREFLGLRQFKEILSPSNCSNYILCQ